ncbi:hypothetical protein GLE_2295 [Lysobacter enzymogenes]|uniref:Uncharacterized protein n=1 Tax=Lysobacter enzymogenes TaxID=69 RepID=A0A0S2DGB9_LYSEN|nr:hypothetical protein GLE_2295 [Lysobacter enzymogenes]
MNSCGGAGSRLAPGEDLLAVDRAAQGVAGSVRRLSTSCRWPDVHGVSRRFDRDGGCGRAVQVGPRFLQRISSASGFSCAPIRHRGQHSVARAWRRGRPRSRAAPLRRDEDARALLRFGKGRARGPGRASAMFKAARAWAARSRRSRRANRIGRRSAPRLAALARCAPGSGTSAAGARSAGAAAMSAAPQRSRGRRRGAGRWVPRTAGCVRTGLQLNRDRRRVGAAASRWPRRWQ